MNMDAHMKRGSFIGRSMEVMDSFAFAAPTQILGAVKLFVSDLYGGMLWRLDGQLAQQLMRC
jgi:hypothetical protein